MEVRPHILDPGSVEDAACLDELRRTGAVWRVDDTLDLQLRDLVKTRSPEVELTPEQIEERVTLLVGDLPPERRGRWVFYPWSGRLVRVLPPAEFRELRRDRNRYKLTDEETARLDAISVGIAGLSVGNAVALTLALEGSFGHLRLADFDRLDLSNLNRIRAGVHDIGVEKTIVAARQIWEIDPYASLSLLHDGVTRDNVDDFLDGLDVIVDECDSIYLKFLIRERARERRLPLLMETSDRGLLDVERFDLEPERPLFHGLAGALTSEDIRGLEGKSVETTDRKAAIVIRLLDAGMISTRLAASMIEVDRSVSTWPQLGSDVTLGGAITTIAVRRLGLGSPLPSGRRYIDVEQAVAEPATDAPLPAPDALRPPPRPELGSAHPRRRDDVPDLARELVRQATLAPSGGNAQPWHFFWDDGRLFVTHDRARSRNILDSRTHATWLALGAAVENAAIAAAAGGLRARVTPFPHDDVAAVIELEPGADDELAALHPLVALRQTNRKLGPRVALEPSANDSLRAAAAARGAALELVDAGDQLEEVGRIIGCADRIRMLCPTLHRELVGELRWPEDEEPLDGVTVSSLDLGTGAAAALHVVARPDVVAELRAWGRGRRLEEGARDSLAAASAAGLLSLAGDSPRAWLEGGRALQRLWLEATALGLAFQPLTVALYLFELLGTENAAIFTADERDELAALQASLYDVFARPSGAPALLFRVARADEPAERALRLPAEWVLSAGVPASLEPELAR